MRQLLPFTIKLGFCGVTGLVLFLVVLVHMRPFAAVLSEKAAGKVYVVVANADHVELEAPELALFWPTLKYVEEAVPGSRWGKEPEFGWDLNWPGFKLRLADYPARSFGIRVSPYLLLLIISFPWAIWFIRRSLPKPSLETDEQSDLPLADTRPEP